MAYTPTDWECGQTVTAEKLNNIERGVADGNSEYTPTTWQCGDVITAEAMNKIEQGIANAGGGGSSDFSTAQVTITGFASGTYISMPFVFENEFLSTSFTMANGIETYETILYKGNAVAHITGDESSVASAEFEVISGDAEIMDGMCLITGDCTIRTKEIV